jgi:hypothetical protein
VRECAPYPDLPSTTNVPHYSPHVSSRYQKPSLIRSLFRVFVLFDYVCMCKKYLLSVQSGDYLLMGLHIKSYGRLRLEILQIDMPRLSKQEAAAKIRFPASHAKMSMFFVRLSKKCWTLGQVNTSSVTLGWSTCSISVGPMCVPCSVKERSAISLSNVREI